MDFLTLSDKLSLRVRLKLKLNLKIQSKFSTMMYQSSARIKGVGPDINCGEDGQKEILIIIKRASTKRTIIVYLEI